MKNPVLSAPAPDSLPKAANRNRRCGPPMTEIRLAVETITPILGGSAMTRQIDETEIIRPATIRGHLRFWWRALNAHRFNESREMNERESEIWGNAAGSRQSQSRSSVEIRVSVGKEGGIDSSGIDLQKTPGAYALWPARSQASSEIPPAPRRMKGTQFSLIVSVPIIYEHDIIETLKAWLVFGGYGSRTRRGLGSFTIKASEASIWLPKTATRDDLTSIFNRDLLENAKQSPTDTPRFSGASLHVLNEPTIDSIKAWTTALKWLKDFRQDNAGGLGNRAREPGQGKPEPYRLSVSNWPEPDKIRHLTRRTTIHIPRHNSVPAWPRAGFGLPILGRFQTQSRKDTNGRFSSWAGKEPDPFSILWEAAGILHDRLASPLIVKALPLADGQFVSCALWLDRRYPVGDVVLKGVPNSGAPFDRLVADGDTSLFSPIKPGIALRTAFLDWLDSTHNTTVVAP